MKLNLFNATASVLSAAISIAWIQHKGVLADENPTRGGIIRGGAEGRLAVTVDDGDPWTTRGGRGGAEGRLAVHGQGVLNVPALKTTAYYNQFGANGHTSLTPNYVDEVLSPPREKSPPMGAASSLVPKIGLAPKRKLEVSDYEACIRTDGLEADLTHHFCFESCDVTNKANTAFDAIFDSNGHSGNTKCGTDGLDFVRPNAFNAVLGPTSSLRSGPVTVAFVIKHGTDADTVSREFWQINRLIVNSEPFPYARVEAKATDGTTRLVRFPNVYSKTEFVQVVITIDGNEISMYKNGVKLTGDNPMWNKVVAAGPTDSTQIGNNGFAGTIKSVAMWNRALLPSEITSGLDPALTSTPTSAPTGNPTSNPTSQPTSDPTTTPTALTSTPTSAPTGNPTSNPTSQPTSDPTSAPTGTPGTTPSSPTPPPTTTPWSIVFRNMTADFSADSDKELVMIYQVGRGRDFKHTLYAGGCENLTTITGLAAGIDYNVTNGTTVGQGGMDTLQLDYSFNKAKIASSNIWDSSSDNNKIELCQVVELIEQSTALGEMIIVSDKRNVTIAFDLSASFDLAVDLEEAALTSANTSTSVQDYVTAYHCNESFEEDNSPLVANDQLFVCIKSSSSDVEIEGIDSMTIKQGTVDPVELPVIVNSTVQYAAITEETAVSTVLHVVLTRVPTNIFSFADDQGIDIVGSVTMRLIGSVGSGRMLQEDIAAADGTEVAILFDVKVALQPEATPEGAMMNSAKRIAGKGLAIIIMTVGTTYALWS